MFDVLEEEIPFTTSWFYVQNQPEGFFFNMLYSFYFSLSTLTFNLSTLTFYIAFKSLFQLFLRYF